MKPALHSAGLLENNHPVTFMEDNRAGRRGKGWLIEENRVLMECCFKSIPEEGSYRQTMAMLWG